MLVTETKSCFIVSVSRNSYSLSASFAKAYLISVVLSVTISSSAFAAIKYTLLYALTKAISLKIHKTLWK